MNLVYLEVIKMAADGRCREEREEESEKCFELTKATLGAIRQDGLKGKENKNEILEKDLPWKR